MDTHLPIHLCVFEKEKFPTPDWSLKLLIAQQAKMDLKSNVEFWFYCCCEDMNNIDNVLAQNFL